MIDLFQTRQKSTNNFIIMISILQAWLKTKGAQKSMHQHYVSLFVYLIVFKGCYLNIRSKKVILPDKFQRLLS